MSYADIYIRYEHKFLRNTYTKEELETSRELTTLESYHEVFERFLTIVILLESASTNRGTFSKSSKDKLSNFIDEHCTGKSYHEIAEQVKEFEMKHLDPKIPNFSQQLYAFVYDRLIEFSRSNIEYETVTTANLLSNVNRPINVKPHLHHSHKRGEILGYEHDFCNWRVEENKTGFPCLAHNFFGFDMHFFIRGYRATAWNSKDLNIGGTGLTRINFTDINNTHKFIDTLKYYQQSLSQLTEAATKEEKEAIKKLTVQYIANHAYFGTAWEKLEIKEKIKLTATELEPTTT